jgi:16S rRNA (uracil1498-N3)-methyltransferase
MPQFLIQSSNIINKKYIITGEDYYHLTKVRRVITGEILDLRGDDGYFYEGRISDIIKESIVVDIITKGKKAGKSIDLNLYISLLKGKKFDLVLQKATEIGVSRIIPVMAERSIPDISRSDNKKKRWEKIVSEAFKQCMREQIPVVEDLLTFKETVLNCHTEIKIIAHPDKSSKNMKEFAAEKNNNADISVLIGPEGGFSDKELAFAKENNWEPVMFGFTALRAETAAIVIPAIMIYEWNFDDNNS